MKGSGVPGEDSCFECNICLDGVREPVVTRCGHLFCWPCLYRWLSTNQTECPVCKAGVSARNIIPLFGRGTGNVDPRTKQTGRDSVPSRPDAERPQAERPRPPNTFLGGSGAGGGWGGFGGGSAGTEGGGTGGQLHYQAGLGFFPSLFGLQFQSFTLPTEPVHSGSEGRGVTSEHQPTAVAQGASGSGALVGEHSEGVVGDNARISTSEEAQQAFLSRLLLLLGSFVLLCLVLF